MQQPEPLWVAYINALSTAAVALFAMVSVWREGRDRRQRARVSRARLANVGSRMRDTIIHWNRAFPVDVIHRTDRAFSDADLMALRKWFANSSGHISSLERDTLSTIDEATSARWYVSRLATAAVTSLAHSLRLYSDLRTTIGTLPTGEVAQTFRDQVAAEMPGMPTMFDKARADALETRVALMDTEARLDKLVRATALRRSFWMR